MKQFSAALLFILGSVLHLFGRLMLFLVFGVTVPWPLPLVSFWFLCERPFGTYWDTVAFASCWLPLLGFPCQHWGNGLRRRAAASMGQTVVDL